MTVLHCNFYPRSPCGERQQKKKSTRQVKHFYPRSPCGERPPRFTPATSRRNFYPRSPCGERPLTDDVSTGGKIISIHALLAESDSRPRALKSRRETFLSTLSLRRATVSAQDIPAKQKHFYPRSPCGERPSITRYLFNAMYFYPRSPCGERLKISFLFRPQIKFLSTLSLRRATLGARQPYYVCRNFYPRSPCGERQEKNSGHETAPDISIHALLAESDLKTPCVKLSIDVFLSTLSLRRATIDKISN